LELGPQRGGEDVTGAADQHGHLVGDHAHVARGASPLGDRDWESIGRHDPGVGHPWGARPCPMKQPSAAQGTTVDPPLQFGVWSAWVTARWLPEGLRPCSMSNSAVCPSCSDSLCGSPCHRPPAGRRPAR
jgi:hypothetical protein